MGQITATRNLVATKVVRHAGQKLNEAEWCIYLSVKQAIIGSDNDLSPVRCQAIIWAIAGLL